MGVKLKDGEVLFTASNKVSFGCEIHGCPGCEGEPGSITVTYEGAVAPHEAMDDVYVCPSSAVCQYTSEKNEDGYWATVDIWGGGARTLVKIWKDLGPPWGVAVIGSCQEAACTYTANDVPDDTQAGDFSWAPT